MLICVLDTPLEESIGALDELRRAGKVKYIGLSECSAATLRKANSSSFETTLYTDKGLTAIRSRKYRCYTGRVFSF